MLKPDIVIPTNDYSSRNGNKIRAGVIHTAEGARDEVELGNYFKNTSRDVSSHWGIGQDGGLALYVREPYASWTALKANPWSVQVEICGFAKWTEAEWKKYPKMLDTIARLLAEWNKDYGFALKHGTIQDMRNGVRAFYDHDDVTKAYGGTHWDVGNGFPWDYVLDLAKKYATPALPAPVVTEGETNVEFKVIEKNDEGLGIILAKGEKDNNLQYKVVNLDGTAREGSGWVKTKVNSVSGGVSAVATGGTGLTIAFRDADGYVRIIDVKDITAEDGKQGWSSIKKLGLKGTSVPVLEQTSEGLVLVVRGQGHGAWSAARKDGSWGGWTNLGGDIG